MSDFEAVIFTVAVLLVAAILLWGSLVLKNRVIRYLQPWRFVRCRVYDWKEATYRMKWMRWW
jgi:hypothetical protein